MKFVQYLIAFAAALIGGVAMASETSLHDAVAAKAKTSVRGAAKEGAKTVRGACIGGCMRHCIICQCIGECKE